MGWPAALTLACLIAGNPAQAPPATPAPVRTVESVSEVVYAAAPDAPHRLVSTYAGADRVRWQLSTGTGAEQKRQVHWRHGELAFVLEKRGTASRELAGEERALQITHMELRRALLCWPEGFAWKRGEDGSQADLGALGSLHARFAKPGDATPSEIVELDPHGESRDAYRHILWTADRGRAVPASAELHHADELVWSETFEALHTRGRYLDSFFLPPDRATAAPVETTPVQTLDVPATCTRRIEIPHSASAHDWQSAIEQVEALHAEWAPRLQAAGYALEGKATVELGPDLEPAACVLRLERVPETPPEGFKTEPARKVAALSLHALGQLAPRHLQRLVSAVPKGTDPRSAYVRFDLGSPTVTGAVLLLPLP
jgi:hypothetical protein